MRIFLFLIAISILICPLMAQTYKVVTTPATCPSNGTITINVTDPPVGTITYTLVDPEGEESPAQTSNLFSGLSPGTYQARVYFGAIAMHEESAPILAQFVVNPPRITDYTIFPAYTCSGQPASNTGQISVNISNTEGSFPFQAYLYSGATYDGTNTLISQVHILSAQSYFNFAFLASGNYCILLTDTCGRSVIQNNMIVNSQNVSYSISVGNTSTVQHVLKVDANCQNYLLDPLLNMNVSTTGFSISSLQYSIEWPTGVFTEYKTYYDRNQLLLPLDYTTWDPTLKIYFKDPCNPSSILGPYTMKLYTAGQPGTYPTYLSTDVVVRDLPDRNMCDVSGKAYIYPYFSLSYADRICYPITVTITSPDDPNFEGPKVYTWTSSNQNNYPSVSTVTPSTTGIVVTAGYNYQCVFTDAKSVYPQTATQTRYINPSQYGIKPKITVTPVEDPRNLGKGRFYITNTELLAAGPYPVTIRSISGPSGYTPFSQTINQKPTTNNTILSTNQPMGNYQVEIVVGNCRKDTVNLVMDKYIPLPDVTSLNTTASTTCNSVNLWVASSFASSPQPLPFNTNIISVAFSQRPTGSTITTGNIILSYNSSTNLFTSYTNSNQPTGTYVYQLYYQDYISPSSPQVPILPTPLTTTIASPVPVIDVPNSGGTVCPGNSTGTLTVMVTGGSANQKKYAIKLIGSPAYGTEQTSNTFTGVAAGKYMVKVNDGCNIIEQELDMVSIASGDVIVGPGPLCENQSGLLATIPVGPVNSITWTLPDLTTRTGPGISISQSVPGPYLYKVNVLTKSGCNISNQKTVQISPNQSTWRGVVSSAWDDVANWDNQLLPGKCTFVTIPAGTPNYPDLTSQMSAACDTILFKFGGEVAKTNYLDYSFAKVDLTLKPNQWYMPAPMLQQQYSGDYLEGQSQYRINPEVSIMYYQTSNPQTGAARVASKFTGLFNNTDELLKIATGHALWVDNGERTDANFTFHFPKDSVQYAYYDVATNQVTRFSGVMPRDKRGRFIYEGNASYQSNQNGTFTQTIENSDLAPQIIIGNPYMSHLDIVEFQKQNNTYLEKSFRIWKNGTSYETYLINDDGTITGTNGGENDFQIPPMQSFIMDTKQLFTAPLLFGPAMSITQPGSSLLGGVNDPDYHEPSNVLHVEITRNGIRQSGLVLRYVAGASNHYDKNKDAWTILPQNVGSYVLMYVLVDGKAASIHSTGNITTPLDLDISVGTSIKKLIADGVKETYTIRIPDGGTMYPGQEIYLYDGLKLQTHNLTQSAYSFVNETGDIAGRFQLFARSNPTLINELSDHAIRIFSVDGRIYVESSPGDPIRQVLIYDIPGYCLHNEVNPDVTEWSYTPVLRNQIVVVKVQTDKENKTEKILLK